MDIMSDALYKGQKIKLLTLVDNFTCEGLAIEIADRLGEQSGKGAGAGSLGEKVIETGSGWNGTLSIL